MSETSPLVIFDWDGTLMDSIPRIVSCMQKMAKEAGLNVPSVDSIKDIIGLSLPVALETLFDCHLEAEQKVLISIYRQYYVYTDETPSPLFPGVVEMLADLKESNVQLAVATGKARQGLDRVWDETNTRHYFDNSCCAYEAPSKPHPEMLLTLMQEQQVESHQTLMIGDSKHDLNMAKKAGIQSLGVTLGVHDEPTLRKQNPIAICNSIGLVHEQIKVWLQKQNMEFPRSQAVS